jgi:hypothetical protein
VLRAKVSNKAEWDEVYVRATPRRAVEALLGAAHRSVSEWHLYGWCDVCAAASRFRCDWTAADGDLPNYRERLTCETCQLNSRQRLVLNLLRDVLAERRPKPGIYAYEEVTVLYRELVRRFPEATVIGSEYLGPEVERGALVDSIRHEDALSLSFEGETFDVVLSNDVYEHVPDVTLALREAHRVLREGGVLMATLPFTFGSTTERRARLADGRVEHIRPPVFHGNPLSEQGSLVFYDFGWDLLDLYREIGFVDVHFLCVHSWFHGYLGDGLTLFATKGGPG